MPGVVLVAFALGFDNFVVAAVGALLAGLIADFAGLAAAIYAVAAITAASGLVVACRMYETHPRSTRVNLATFDTLDLEG